MILIESFSFNDQIYYQKIIKFVILIFFNIYSFNIYIPNFFTRREKREREKREIDRNNLDDVNFAIRIPQKRVLSDTCAGTMGYLGPLLSRNPTGVRKCHFFLCGLALWIGQQKQLSKWFRHANKKLLSARDGKRELTSGAPHTLITLNPASIRGQR